MPYKFVLIFALLIGNIGEAAAQRKSYIKNYYSVINLAIESYKRPYKPVADSTIHIDIEECFPSIFSELRISKSDSILIRSQIQVQNQYRARLSGRRLSTPLIKKDSVLLLYKKQRDSIIANQAVSNIYIPNFLEVSEPVFFKRSQSCIIRLNTIGGSYILYLRKKKRQWKVVEEMCITYY